MESNSIMTLDLYKDGNTWCFDDNTFNITREPFVLGMSEIISNYLPEDAKKCNIIFSHSEFPTCETLTLDYEEANGGWYTVESNQMRGWLCPVTRVYMRSIPQKIYFKVNRFNLNKITK